MDRVVQLVMRVNSPSIPVRWWVNDGVLTSLSCTVSNEKQRVWFWLKYCFQISTWVIICSTWPSQVRVYIYGSQNITVFVLWDLGTKRFGNHFQNSFLHRTQDKNHKHFWVFYRMNNTFTKQLLCGQLLELNFVSKMGGTEKFSVRLEQFACHANSFEC